VCFWVRALRYASTCKRIQATSALAVQATSAQTAPEHAAPAAQPAEAAEASVVLVQSLRGEVDTLRRQLLSLGSAHRAPRSQAGSGSSGSSGSGGGGGSGGSGGSDSEAVWSLRREVAVLKADAEAEAARLHKMKEYIQRQHVRLKDEVESGCVVVRRRLCLPPRAPLVIFFFFPAPRATAHKSTFYGPSPGPLFFSRSLIAAAACALARWRAKKS
jgi:uncharacterized lipoprotein YbaY